MYFLDTYFDLGDLGPFLLFLLFMAISIISDVKRKQKRRQQQTDIPPILYNPTLKTSSKKSNTFDTISTNTKEQKKAQADITKIFQDLLKVKAETSKPKTNTNPNNIETINYVVKPKINTLQLKIETSSSYSTPKTPNYPPVRPIRPRPSRLDFIQQQEIKTPSFDNNTNTSVQIDIEKKHILQAIMYAQVLGAPKSLNYFQHFGIRRVVNKD